MYSRINSTETYNLDSSILLKTVISKKELNKIFEEKGTEKSYEYLKKTYGTSCFIIVRTPLFNKDITTIILIAEYYCGPLFGESYIFILKKNNNQWILTDKR